MAIQRVDFPLPDVDDALTAPFFAAAARHELVIPHCAACAAYVWYPVERCPTCDGTPEWTRVSGRGTLFSWAVVRRAFLPAFAEQVPFVTALIALDEDPFVRVPSYVVDADPMALAADQPVVVDFRELRFPTVPDRSVIVPMFRPGARSPVIFHSVRVVDLTRGIAGAYAAKLLADLGADVVFTTPITDPLFTYLRTSQHHTRDPAPWIDAADIVLVGEPGVVDGTVPLVTVSVTPLGHGGPDDGLDLPEEVLQARSGSLSAHGHAGRPPLTVGGNIGEYVTGAFAALGAATAWWRASRTGIAERVDVSMLEAMQLTFVTVPTVMTRFPGGRLTTQRWVMIPGNEPTADGRFVGITTVTAAQWLALCRLMGRDDLTDDDELTTMMGAASAPTR